MMINFDDIKKPNLFLHPFKYIVYRRLIRDLKIAIDLIKPYYNELAPIFKIDNDNLEVILNYCYNGTGDILAHRNTYLFDGSNGLDKELNLKLFKSMVLGHYVSPTFE